MHRTTRRTPLPLAGLPAGLLEHALGSPAVRPGVVDTAQRRLALAPLPTAMLLAASMVDVLVAWRRHAPATS